jgi:signal transduction histidine kinase
MSNSTENPESPARSSLAEELRKIPVFADLPTDGLEWLAEQMTFQDLAAGEIVTRAGTPADRMLIMLGGEIRVSRESGKPEATVRGVRAPAVTGMLPYSRMITWPGTAHTVVRSRLATFPAERFPEMLARLPVLGPRLVATLSDRVREITKRQDQQEKLGALGRISAGLAHELNNPAAAAHRAGGSLRTAFLDFRKAAARLNAYPLSAKQQAAIFELERELSERPAAAAPLDPLERSDREEAIAQCLLRHGVTGAWELAPTLAEAGCQIDWIEHVSTEFPPDVFPDLMTRVSAAPVISGLVTEIENSTARISGLVRAIKEYTFMDQGPDQEVDLHQGLESTLQMLRHQTKNGITVTLNFERTLPKILAHGSALNQVWTNLIDNAIEAMQGQGELRIRTARELDNLLVEIGDNGPGIPPETRSHIFEPFFTTKGAGQGRGLGLDTACRIVREHSGEITVESAPGDTRFQVRLPLGSL